MRSIDTPYYPYYSTDALCLSRLHTPNRAPPIIPTSPDTVPKSRAGSPPPNSRSPTSLCTNLASVATSIALHCSRRGRRGASGWRTTIFFTMLGGAKIFVYELPQALIAAHNSNTGQEVLQTTLHAALRESPYSTASGMAADFYYVPISFHWGGRGRAAAAAVLSYVRTNYPFFNRSNAATHLLVFTGDLAMDAPATRRFSDPLPPEIDVASPLRRFVALTLTGNPESGFQRGKDIVLPPTHLLKGGPSSTHDVCCASLASQAAAPARRPRRPRRATPTCKPTSERLEESPWRFGGPAAVTAPSPEVPLSSGHHPSSSTATTSSSSRPPRYLIEWAGQASGGGMGRHGGSGPRVRKPPRPPWRGREASGGRYGKSSVSEFAWLGLGGVEVTCQPWRY